MNEQALGLRKERKLSPALVREICWGAQKGLNQDTLGFIETWNPQDMQKDISWDWDSSREHAHGYKERRWICPISRPWFKKRLMT